MAKTVLNSNKVEQWKADVQQSIAFYNEWFLRFAPQTYISERSVATSRVEKAFELTRDLTNISADILKDHPDLLHILRMLTAPPVARDRLSGLSFTPKSVITNLEDGKIPRVETAELENYLNRMVSVVDQLLDRLLFEWLDEDRLPKPAERKRVASVIADRLCGADANPIIRNEQERRQIGALCSYLDNNGYRRVESSEVKDFRSMESGTYCDHLVVMVEDNAGRRQKRIPVDMVVKPVSSANYDLPILIECKSAGDYTNTNKRQKEEAQKMNQLRETYGHNLYYILFLCGYFDTSFQGYVASEGIDWVWEHRIGDFDLLLK